MPILVISLPRVREVTTSPPARSWPVSCHQLERLFQPRYRSCRIRAPIYHMSDGAVRQAAASSTSPPMSPYAAKGGLNLLWNGTDGLAATAPRARVRAGSATPPLLSKSLNLPACTMPFNIRMRNANEAVVRNAPISMLFRTASTSEYGTGSSSQSMQFSAYSSTLSTRISLPTSRRGYCIKRTLIGSSVTFLKGMSARQYKPLHSRLPP